MDGSDWSTLAANVGSIAVAVVSLFGVFWAIVSKQTKNLISENAVSNVVYERQQKTINEKIERLEKSDAEFRVMQSQIQGVQRSVEGLKNDLRDNAEQQRAELNGGLARLGEDMRQFAKAVAGKP